MKVDIFANYPVDDILADLSSRWLDSEGRIKLLPAEEFKSVPLEHLRIWCTVNAYYSLPTLELIQWLKNRIGNMKAIEIGAGNNDLGYHLGITMTDNYCQQTSSVKDYYKSLWQSPTSPPSWVKKYEAVEAIKKTKPQIVIGSWITRKFIEGKDIVGVSEASVYGPIEEDIIKHCPCYIHIGNYDIHSKKTILSRKHSSFTFPWLVSRAANQDRNVIFVWEK